MISYAARVKGDKLIVSGLGVLKLNAWGMNLLKEGEYKVMVEKK